MIEKIIELVSKAFFREQYLKGFVAERHDEKREYRLMGLFPNDIAKEKVINLLEKEPVLESVSYTHLTLPTT